MAPNKFEEEIKQKLEQRTLQPSDNAWAKLSKTLDADTTPKHKINPWWLGIAACIVLLLGLSIPMLVLKPKVEITPTVAETNTQITPKNVTKTTLNIPEIKNVTPQNTPNKQQHNNIKPKVRLTKQHTVVSNGANTTEIVANTKKPILKNKSTSVSTALLNNDNNLTDNQITVDDVKPVALKASDKALNAEIDALLNNATQQLTSENSQKQILAKAINPNTLLQNVEDDMGQSFRTQIYKALKTGFNEVKTTLVHRNK